MSDDFFASLDKTIADRKAEAAGTAEATARAREHEAFMIAEGTKIAREYAEGLKARGISLVVSGSGSLWLKMKFANGKEHSLHLRPVGLLGLEPMGHYVDREGHAVHSTSGQILNQETWSPEAFKEVLQGLIESYVYASKYHGGFA